ncbi:MAG TPA: MFS transporter [Polyangiaceae bacterium]|nr:MFS transporter [Polyangiaceae bacterium]
MRETQPRAWLRVGFLLFAAGWGANHFTSLLLVYRARLNLDAAAPGLLFAMYALGLAPGLLLAGPLSDRHGRRALVLPGACVALGASALLGASGTWFGALLLGRFLYGFGAGSVMSAGAVWLMEISASSAPGTGARRATIALSSGFGLGPFVTGALAQFAPAPTKLPFALHVLVLAGALLGVRRVRETSRGTGKRSSPLLRVQLMSGNWPRFLRRIAPMAPFVFGFPALAFAALPNVLGTGALGPLPFVYTGLLCGLTLAAGVIAQPLTLRFTPQTSARIGLVTGAVGVALGALVVATHASWALLVVGPVLGVAYGVCMTAGLQASQRLASPEGRGGVTGLYYVLTYVGFAAPYLLALAMRAVTPELALEVTAAVALVIALFV